MFSRLRYIADPSSTNPFSDRINVVADAPEHEQIEEQMCPPHNFDQGWGLAADDDIHADTVPVLYCASCGEVRALRIPTDAA